MNKNIQHPDWPPRLPRQRPFDLVGLGANASDVLIRIPRHPAPDEKVRYSGFDHAIGGQTAVALAIASSFGYRCAYHGGVGDDEEGARIVAGLREMGLDIEGLKVRQGGNSQVAFILVDEKTANRTILWGRSEGMVLRPEEICRDRIEAGRIFFTDAQNPLSAATAAVWAKEAGMTVIADLEPLRPGIGRFLPLIDILIAEEAFPQRATGASDLADSLPVLVERTAGALVMVTRGKAGVTVHLDGINHDFPAYAVEAVNTTGAGDVFHGAFAVACLKGMPLVEAIDFSQAAAALKCAHPGAIADLEIDSEKIEQFRRRTPHREENEPPGYLRG